MKRNKTTNVVLCPKYKKHYPMEVVSYTGQVYSENSSSIVTKYICPACGEFHTVET